MTALDLDTLIRMTEAELTGLRQRYATLALTGRTPALRMFCDFLRQREDETIHALTEHRTRHCGEEVLGLHVRLGWGFPFADAGWPEDPSLDDLIEIAELSDAALSDLGERVQLYTCAVETTAVLQSLEALVLRRRRTLSSATRELEDISVEDGREPREDGRIQARFVSEPSAPWT